MRARKADFRVHGPGKSKVGYSAELGYGFILPYDEGPELLVRREDVFDSGL